MPCERRHTNPVDQYVTDDSGERGPQRGREGREESEEVLPYVGTPTGSGVTMWRGAQVTEAAEVSEEDEDR